MRLPHVPGDAPKSALETPAETRKPPRRQRRRRLPPLDHDAPFAPVPVRVVGGDSLQKPILTGAVRGPRRERVSLGGRARARDIAVRGEPAVDGDAAADGQPPVRVTHRTGERTEAF